MRVEANYSGDTLAVDFSGGEEGNDLLEILVLQRQHVLGEVFHES